MTAAALAPTLWVATTTTERTDPVSHSTGLLEQLALDGQLPNIRRAPSGDGWQVRVHPRNQVVPDIVAAVALQAAWLAEREATGQLSRYDRADRERRTIA